MHATYSYNDARAHRFSMMHDVHNALENFRLKCHRVGESDRVKGRSNSAEEFESDRCICRAAAPHVEWARSDARALARSADIICSHLVLCPDGVPCAYAFFLNRSVQTFGLLP